MDKLRSIGIKSIPKGNKSVRAYNSIRYPKIPLSANDLYVIATVGDRVDLIADQYYNDKELWWIITIANPGIVKGDSWYIKPGVRFRIPPSAENIINDFNRLNSGRNTVPGY